MTSLQIADIIVRTFITAMTVWFIKAFIEEEKNDKRNRRTY